MSTNTNLITETATAELRAEAEQEILGYLQGHFTSGELDSAAGLLSDLGSIVAATAVTVADNVEGRSLSFTANVALSNVFTPVSIVIDVAEGDSVAMAGTELMPKLSPMETM